MAISFHPTRGTILICDFSVFKLPEMTKRRPVVVLSPQIHNRPGLCTIVPMSTTPPNQVMPYHYRLVMKPPLPPPYDSPMQWVKCDMIYSLSFDRFNFPYSGKNSYGKRNYIAQQVPQPDIDGILKCVMAGLGFFC